MSADLPLEHVSMEPNVAADGPAPSAFVLHGRGADEEDLLSVAQRLPDELHVVSLRAPNRLMGGYTWYELDVPDGNLVVMPPIEYRSDRTIDLTVVGSADALQTAIDEAPPGVDAEIRSIGSYDAGRMEAASALSERQAAAATTAVDCGYYETPREGSVADVADRLDCARRPPPSISGGPESRSSPAPLRDRVVAHTMQRAVGRNTVTSSRS